MLDWLGTAERRGAFNAFDEFLDPQAFERLISRLASRNWIAYAKKPFRDSIHVMKYLGRYTHRVAIANGRIVDVTATRVGYRLRCRATAGHVGVYGPFAPKSRQAEIATARMIESHELFDA